ncbi:hypothetical protein HYR54_03400 [Candidatus Acetothermia bacterium]|nr:hypothetical protein [Candidatus Acetothermia bacterium]
MRWWKAGLVVIGLAGAALILIWLAQDFVPIEADDEGWLQDVVWLSPNFFWVNCFHNWRFLLMDSG